MSSPIWTPAALSSEVRPHATTCWRVVEAQHRVSTLKLVDTLAEQAVLEALIEDTKPAIPAECRHLDPLLATPFRYGAVYPTGSRFRRAGRTAGVYYGTETETTAVAEIAFHRVLFFAESPETPWPDEPAEHTAFSVTVASGTALDLTAPPLDRDASIWAHPTDYEPCQALADAAREVGATLIRYRSVRDPDGGAALAVLACSAFTVSRPVDRRTWRLRLGRLGVVALREFPSAGIEFGRGAFAADPRIEGMRWDR